MDFPGQFLQDFVKQLQSPTLGFLLGGMVIAALGSQLQIPDAIYKFIIFMLLMKVGLSGGIAIRSSNLQEMLLPALFAVAMGILIVFIGRYTLAKLPKVKTVDAIATAGLFGAVSGSTMAAALTALEAQKISYEPWAAALYPFMDIPALVTAIVVASIYLKKKQEKKAPASLSAVGAYAGAGSATGYAGSTSEYPSSASEYRSQQSKRVRIWPIVKESLQGAALSALLLGVALGIFTRPDSVYESFYNPLFRGLLSVLMLVMGMEAWSRLGELRKVAQWYVVYAVVAPLVHGLIAFGLGMIAHYVTGFSLGGVVILAVIACSSSDISGPPTLRAGIPSANPSAYIGASTAIGTPIAIGLGIPLYLGLAQAIMGGS
ncbi:sodium-dependent bicarbonate transport family permease [Thermosynechococcus sp. QKsg1]|uniref:sodium-dependent bicarbonate transport family permease n=1 Tax=unclassified Thermosynechococcus TaxID=2622553 RepID=UPI002577AEDE|nr:MULTISPECIES: sodium-dependent bicarbonate transport family permease [unclassified Thermosynechococcus]WJI23032.1 sodium-dependent bicarbonate transport family permease [Thermosynechococcus sp. B0]WJI25547.1 sodium-dependent bicarbonate transport family permease [Thermosynechococcus sp. B1]WJI28079.1 sodium-dependent bicarbonate transport family permease [Thermosynechococcus sp. B3]WNC85650.1 sodium-dependent bicarbonate transport family permease [Thermosynechococcus sp. QKsg1]